MGTQLEVTIREAAVADLGEIQRVCRESDRAPWTEKQTARRPDRVVLVAVVADRLVGAAKTHHQTEPDGVAPAGHYLGGLVVDPAWRRLGVGHELTAARLAWIWGRADHAFYFTNESNEASIALHRGLGFEPIARSRAIMGVDADGDEAQLVLFSASRPG